MKPTDKQIAYLENELHIAKVNLKHSHDELYIDYFRDRVQLIEAVLATVRDKLSVE